MANITVSTDIDTLLQSANNAAARASIGADVRTDANGAFSAGDLGGNARGANAINIQATRAAVTQVASGPDAIAIGNNSAAAATGSTALGRDATASGTGSTAVGNNSSATGYSSTALGTSSSASAYYGTAVGNSATASGYSSSMALGNSSTASGYYATAVGYSTNASNTGSTALGRDATASGYRATASGTNSTASGSYSTAVGSRAKTTVSTTTELGVWSGPTVRAGAIRVHATGMVAQTIQNRATAYGDGGATKGSEADNTVIREGIALRRNGNEILVDLNIGGTVTTLSLGTAS